MISLFILNFFLINLFVGVLCEHFLKAKDNNSPEKIYFVTNQQQKWIQYQLILLKIKPLSQTLTHTNLISLCVHKIVISNFFEIFSVVCTVSNIIILSMNYDGSSISYRNVLENINYIFTAIFIIELILKVIAFGLKNYLDSNWNKLDLFIVISSIIDLFINLFFNNTNSFFHVGPQIIRIFRVLRVIRIFKIIKKLKGLQKLIEILISALPSLFNLWILYCLVFFIYAILGVFLFQDVKTGNFIDEYNHFQNVFAAVFTLFRMVTGENWWNFMFDCYRLPPNCEENKTCGNGNFFQRDYLIIFL